MYDRIIARVTRTPWAILPEKLGEIAELLRFRAAGGRLTADEIQARLGDTPDAPGPTRVERTVAVIPVYGTIVHRAGSFEAFSGGTSAEMLGKYIRRAVQDETVKAIVLDVASPGGTVTGVPELAAEIMAARKVKPVIASANGLAASAAYWLASQASEFVVTPSGQVGSIGVYLLTEDISEHLAKEGVRINAISAGDHKLEGAPWEPMSDETRAFLQGQVDETYADFIKAVAAGRKVTQATVKEKFGQGRVYKADEALKRGMIDRIETFDETIARLLKQNVTHTRGQRADGMLGASTIAAETDVASPVLVEAGMAAEAIDIPADGAALIEATAVVTAEPETIVQPAVEEAAARLVADQDYIDAGIRIAERL